LSQQLKEIILEHEAGDAFIEVWYIGQLEKEGLGFVHYGIRLLFHGEPHSDKLFFSGFEIKDLLQSFQVYE